MNAMYICSMYARLASCLLHSFVLFEATGMPHSEAQLLRAIFYRWRLASALDGLQRRQTAEFAVARDLDELQSWLFFNWCYVALDRCPLPNYAFPPWW